MHIMNNQDNYNRLSYTIFNTSAGWIGLLASPHGCLRATFPRPTREMAGLDLGQKAAQANHSPEHFKVWTAELESYFDGDRVEFSGKIDLSLATPFERSVWRMAKSIPYGETQSYSWIARQIGKPQAPRAVGQALGRNPLPIIVPCHRVLSSDGKLGGFGGGLEMKRFLLALEAKR